MIKIDADSLELAFSTGKPLKISYTIGDSIRLVYLLALYEVYEEDEDFNEDFDDE